MRTSDLFKETGVLIGIRKGEDIVLITSTLLCMTRIVLVFSMEELVRYVAVKDVRAKSLVVKLGDYGMRLDLSGEELFNAEQQGHRVLRELGSWTRLTTQQLSDFIGPDYYLTQTRIIRKPARTSAVKLRSWFGKLIDKLM